MPDPNLISLIRQMPTDRARAYAEGLCSLLAYRPDLRKLYSAADLAYVEHLTRKEKYAKAEGRRLYYSKAAGESYKFSSTQFNIADANTELADAMIAMAKSVPEDDLADDGREDQPHVTVKYGLHSQSANEVRNLIEGFGPVRVKLGKVSIFPATGKKDFDVVKVDVQGDDLIRLNHFISERLECTDSYPDYKPHITIAYVEAGKGGAYDGDDRFEGMTVTFKKLQFSNKAKEKTIISLSSCDALAHFYAAALNDYLAAGLAVTTDDIAAIDDELSGTSYRLDYAKQRWVAVEPNVLHYAAAHAPSGGVTIAGKFYRGGQWIPAEAVAKADAKTKAKITGEATKRKEKRSSRGPVDSKKLRERLTPHSGKLSKADHASAMRSLRALRDHHGELTLHRLEELVGDTEMAHDAAGDKETKKRLAGRLKALHAMLEEEVKASGEAEDKPAADEPDIASVAKRLQPYENIELDENDVRMAVGLWESVQRDYGDFIPHYIEDAAEKHLAAMDEEKATLPKGAKASRERIERETGKRLAVLAWMADRHMKESKTEPDLGEALDRIAYAEQSRTRKVDGERRTSPWIHFVLNGLANATGKSISQGASDYTSPESIFNNLKAGKYDTKTLDAVLSKMPREYGTMSGRQLRKLLPHLSSSSATITPEIVAKLVPKSKPMASAARG